MKSASRLLPDGWVGLKSSGYRCHFRAFQLKLFILDTRNFGNGSVVQKLQLFEVARISEFFSRPEKKWQHSEQTVDDMLWASDLPPMGGMAEFGMRKLFWELGAHDLF